MAMVTSLPIPDSERKARLALRIADSITKMELSANHINACVRIGMVCMDQGYTLIGAYSHAVKVARRIIFVRTKSGECYASK
jgi:hypothetical protein